MTTEPCAELRLLIQADVDGELAPAEAARVANHLTACTHCADIQTEMLALSGQIRREAAYHPVPNTLRTAIQLRLASATEQPSADEAAQPPSAWQPARRRFGVMAPFGAGFALAACLVLALMLPQRSDVSQTVVAGHIRALQPGHLMDVASTDQHIVKPWFDGRLDFAPPVKDLKPDGFSLAGARLDYVSNRPVAALVYQRRQHVIDLYVWPDDGTGRLAPETTEHSGYNVLRWSRDGMVFWAVSDLGAPELADFVRLWQTY